MQKQSVPERRVSVAKSTLWGFVGSTAGAVVGFSIGWVIGVTMPGWEGLYIFLLAGYFLAGAGVGITLGLTAGKRRIPLVTLASAFGFTIAFLVSMFGSVGIGTAGGGAIFGGVAGAVLGLALRGRKTAGLLALSGAVACAIVSPVQAALGTIAYQDPQTTFMVILGLVLLGSSISIVALGTTLGAAFGYLENRTVNRNH